MTVLSFTPELAFAIWGYDLRGPGVLEISARIAEEGCDADLNGRPLWDHPEWLEGWQLDGKPYTPPLYRSLPYAPGSPWSDGESDSSEAVETL
jgi:hypothetical protein